MRTLIPLAYCLPVSLLAQPQPGYYDTAAGLSGPALRVALHQIITPHTVLANNALWSAFESTDRKPDGSVWDIYSDVPGGSPAYVYQFVEDQCGTYAAEGDCFNREHAFPQSWYGSAAPMSTDLFHLYPVDAWVNQQRGNLPYGRVGQANWTSTNGGKRGNSNWPGYADVVFEPIDEYKGDLARSYFYMMTRYLPQLGGWNTPMMVSGDLAPWAVSLLLAWHEQDPVSDKEQERNNAVEELQGNRNPYIDQPGWAPSIWGPFAGLGASEVNTVPQLWYHGGALHRVNDTGDLAELRVQDITGRVVWNGTMPGTELRMDEHLPTGLYVATLAAAGRQVHLRFVH